MKKDQELMKSLIAETVTVLCKSGLQYNKGLIVEGLVVITVDDSDVFYVRINESCKRKLDVTFGSSETVQDANQQLVSRANLSQPTAAKSVSHNLCYEEPLFRVESYWSEATDAEHKYAGIHNHTVPGLLESDTLTDAGQQKSSAPVSIKQERQDVVDNMHHLVAADEQPSTNMRYTCEVCNKKFKKRSNLIHHKLVHSQPGKYSCTNCDKRFSYVVGLKAHQRIVHNVTTGQHVCQMCNKSFTQGQNLTRHIRIVHGLDQRKRKCNIDDKSTRNSNRNVCSDDRNASADKENTHNDIENTCNEDKIPHKNAENPCHDDKNTYNSEKDCVGDMRVQQSLSNMPVNERLFSCDICYASFKRKEHVVKHMHTHIKRRQLYPCTACAKTFKCNKSLKVHMRTHSDEKPYACAVCNSTFKWPKEFSKHMRSHAEKTQLHVTCPVCGKTVASAVRLANHLSNVHKVKDTATGGDFEIVYE